MNDALTQAVLQFQQGVVPLDQVRNLILVETFLHLSRYRKKGEDEVSEFLLDFHSRIPRLVDRFRPQGLPFRHYLLRTLRWQWNSFKAERARQRRVDSLASTMWAGDEVAEPGEFEVEGEELEPSVVLEAVGRRRLVLLALKSATYLNDRQVEVVSRQSGADLAWLQACQHRLRASTLARVHRNHALVERRGEALHRRLLAEEDARREVDPERRARCEHRAELYRSRLASLDRQKHILSLSPTHQELARVLGMPKGTVDSSLYHLKRALNPTQPGSLE